MKHLLSFLLFLIPFAMQSQVVGDYTESELATQTTFLDALLKKHQAKTDDAINLFKECIATDNRNHAASFELAKIYLAKDNNEEAIRYGAKALEQAPKNRWYLVFMSNIYIEALDYSKAATLLKQMTKDYPQERYFYEQLAFAQRKNDQDLKAIATLDALEKVIGVDEENIKKKFELYTLENNLVAAEAELQKLCDSDPKNARYLGNLAHYKLENNNKAEALSLYKRILEIDPNNERANIVLASVSDSNRPASNQDHPLTKIIKNPAIDIDPKVKELIPYVENAAKLDSVKQVQLASLLSTLRETHPRSPKATALSADFYNQILDTQNAINWYEKTLELNDNIFNVWDQLMLTQIEVKDFKSLLARSEQAIDLFPNQAGAYIYHAKALIEVGQKKEAKDILDEARLIAGNNKILLEQINSLQKEL